MIVSVKGGNHEMCVLGPNRSSSGTNLGSNFSSWDQTWAICDPWANIACRPADYPNLFKEKMVKWKQDYKQIWDGVSNFPTVANSDIWVGPVLNNEKNVMDAG